MSGSRVRLQFAQPLRWFLPSRWRDGDVEVAYDETSSLGHVVQSVGVPLTEVGALRVNGLLVQPAHRLTAGCAAEIAPVHRPQILIGLPRFVLDVHLGSLARRMRLVGLDIGYATDASDDDLLQQAIAETRVLLSKDRGLLRRRACVGRAAYVRGDHPDRQLADVLDRFALPLTPFSRCLRCNGPLLSVPKGQVLARLEAGTARSYQTFVRCRDCHRIYWRGAHASRLDDLVATATAVPGWPTPTSR